MIIKPKLLKSKDFTSLEKKECYVVIINKILMYHNHQCKHNMKLSCSPQQFVLASLNTSRSFHEFPVVQTCVFQRDDIPPSENRIAMLHRTTDKNKAIRDDTLSLAMTHM